MPDRVDVRRWFYLSVAFNCLALLDVLSIWWRPDSATLLAVRALVFAFFFFISRWDQTSCYLRFVLLLAVVLALYRSAGALGLCPFIAGMFVLQLLVRQSGRRVAVHLAFPLRGQLVYVANGGGGPLLNSHTRSSSQRFALDVVALNWWGARARGIAPRALESYVVYGKIVYSPCCGVVTAALNNLDDAIPGEMSKSNPAGNHIVIRIHDTDVFVGLAHLMAGSICVRTGDIVAVGQALARVGNSGRSSEPHLHIHAKRGGMAGSMLDGEGVPMRFARRFLVRNSLVVGRSAKSSLSGAGLH